MDQLLDECSIANKQGFNTWGLSANKIDYTKALKQDSWTVREALCWLHGRNPVWCHGDIREYFRDEVDLALRAINSGKLSKENSPPNDWIAWAISKDWNVPDNLRKSAEKVRQEPHDGATGNDNSTSANSGEVTQKQIKLIFDKLRAEQWRGHFGRENENGLSAARIGEKGKPKYLLDSVSNWLQEKGLYTKAGTLAAIQQYSEPLQKTASPTKPSKKNCLGRELAHKVRQK